MRAATPRPRSRPTAPAAGRPRPRRRRAPALPWWRRLLTAAGLRRFGLRLGLLLLLVAALPPLADALFGALPVVEGCRVLRVVDGDTLDLRCPGQGIVRARPTGFDAPELFSPGCASEALAALQAQGYLRWTLARAGHLEVMLGGTDRYGRRLVEVHVDGDRLADRMTAAGMARDYDGGPRQGWCG